jgi:hypothetical protein
MGPRYACFQAGAQMLRKLLLWIVAVIGLVAVSQSASAQVIYACRTSIGILFEVAEGAMCAQGSTPVSWNVTGPQGPLHVNFGSVASAPSPVIFPGAISASVFASQPCIYRENIHT